MNHQELEEARRQRIIAFITSNWNESNESLAGELGIHVRTVQKWRTRIKSGSIAKNVQNELDASRDKKQLQIANAKLKEAYTRIDTLSKIVEVRDELKNSSPDRNVIKIKGSKNDSDNESILTAVWSDWHLEETIDSASVNDINEYNLDIAKNRVQACIENTVRLYHNFSVDTKINTIVLALLGDFITNDIHEELVEVSSLRPMEACLWARSILTYGIKYILENTPDDVNIIVQCHSGNHSRTTKTTRFATEAGHSLEYMMYRVIADDFKDNPRLKFNVPTGYHSYLSYYGSTIRFHHGHAVKFGGGVGGVTIPTNKAIHGWNSIRHADLDVFGHFHQFMDGQRFIINGSLIGFSPFALSIKAEVQSPKQIAFLWHKKYKKTIVAPIIVE